MISFHTTTRVWLSLEEYTNKGLKQEELIEELRRTLDPGGFGLLPYRVEKMGLNHNIIVETSLPESEAYLVAEDVEMVCRCLLGIGLSAVHSGNP